MENKVNKLKDEIPASKLKQITLNKQIPIINKDKVLKSIKENPIKNLEGSSFAHSINKAHSKKLIFKRQLGPNSILNNTSNNNVNNTSNNGMNNYSFIKPNLQLEQIK